MKLLQALQAFRSYITSAGTMSLQKLRSFCRHSEPSEVTQLLQALQTFRSYENSAGTMSLKQLRNYLPGDTALHLTRHFQQNFCAFI
jgi:hypothetical protein